MSKKISLDYLVDSLLQETSQEFIETQGLKWEWEHWERINEILGKIKKKECVRDGILWDTDKKKDNERRIEKFQPFLRWMNENEVDTSHVDIVLMGDSGFGLKVKKSFKTGDLVLAIPDKIILTSSKVSTSKLKYLIEKDPILNGMSNVALAMFLVYEKFGNSESYWNSYIDTLPLIYDTIFYFTKDEMLLLKNAQHAFREALRMLRNVARQYSYFHTKFRRPTDSATKVLKSCFTYNRYIWAVSGVITRVNPFPNSSGGDEIFGLVPLWDLLNHDENKTEISTDFRDQSLLCYTTSDLQPDEEFKIFYGRRSSIDLLVHNGFVPNNIQYDFYYLELGIGINDLNYTRKKAILAHVGLGIQQGFWLKCERLPYAKDLFIFLRVFNANKELLEKIEEKIDNLEFLYDPNEECWKFLATRFEILKKSFENANANALKTIFGEKNSGDEELSLTSNRTKMVLQILKNEQKLCSLLAHCSNDNLNKLKKLK